MDSLTCLDNFKKTLGFKNLDFVLSSSPFSNDWNVY